MNILLFFFQDGGLVGEVVEQASKASPFSEVVYSLIVLILLIGCIVFFRLYVSEKKHNRKMSEKALGLAEIVTSVKLRMDDEKDHGNKLDAILIKLDKIIDGQKQADEIRMLAMTIKNMVERMKQ